MRDRYVVAMDEFPLILEKPSSLDYGGFIIYRIIGDRLLDISNGNHLQDFKVELFENYLTIQDYTNDKSIVKELQVDLDNLYEKWKGKYKLLFLGINIENNKLYIETDNGIVIHFRNINRVYVFLCVLQSHFCNHYKTNDFVVNSGNSIVVQSGYADRAIEFVRVKNRFLNLLLYHMKIIDVTANNVIDSFTYRLYKNYRNLMINKSGIECIITCTNRNSIFYHDFNKRREIYSLICSDEILKSLDVNLTQSQMYVSYEQRVYTGCDISEISITYDNYYPNKQIVTKLKRQLQSAGIKVKLRKGDFSEPTEIADFRLYLFCSPFQDNVFSYYFLGMTSDLHLFEKEYHSFLESYSKYCSLPLENEMEKKKMKKILTEKSIYLSIGELNNTYLSRYRDLDFIYEKKLRVKNK